MRGVPSSGGSLGWGHGHRARFGVASLVCGAGGGLGAVEGGTGVAIVLGPLEDWAKAMPVTLASASAISPAPRITPRLRLVSMVTPPVGIFTNCASEYLRIP